MAEKELPRIVVLEPVTNSVKELLRIIEDKNQAEIMAVTTGDEAAQLASQFMPCMLVACAMENPDIPNRVATLKKIEKGIKKGHIKTLFVSKLKNKQLSQLISSLGVTDYMEEPVPVRTMQFKANLQIKAIETIRKQEAQRKASEEKMVFKQSDKKKNDDPANLKSDSASAKLKPALNVNEDTFLFKNSGIKKIGKKVTMELDGPAPETGEWVQHEDKGDAKSSWRWVPEDKKDSPEAKKGDGWVHSGEKPIYNPETKKWQMTSEKPELALQKEGKKVATKISTDENGEVEVAADSPAAEENLKKNEEIVQKKAAQKAEEQKLLLSKKEASQEAKKQEIKDANAATAEANKEANEKKIAAKEQLRKLEKEQLEAASKSSVDASAEATFNNKTGGETDPAAEFNNKTGQGSDTLVDANTNSDSAKKEPDAPAVVAKKAPINPLEFLKKRKEEAKKSGDSGEKEAAFNDKSAEGAKAAHTEVKDKRSKSISDKINRLKNKLGDGIGDPKPEEEKPEELEGLKKLEKTREDESQAPVELKEEVKPSEDTAPLKTVALEKQRIEKKAAEHKEKLAKHQADRKKLQKEIQAEVNKGVQDTLSPEEEEEARKKLGLVGRKDISAKEIAKRAKLDRLKDLKNKLADLDSVKLEDDAPPEANVHDLKKDEIDNTWSEGANSSLEKKSTKIRAFDSELSDEEKEEAEKKRKKLELNKIEAEKKGLRSENKFHYMPEASLQPLGGAWEATGENYVYLSGEIKYHGFKALKDILPLWIFQGSGVPELLDKSNEWKFNEAIPFQAHDIKDVPDEVRDYLLGLREQINNEKANPEEAAAKAKNSETVGKSEEENSKREKSADSTIEADERSEKKKKNKNNDISDRLESLKSSLDDESSEFQEKAESESKDKTRENEEESSTIEKSKDDASPDEERSIETKSKKEKDIENNEENKKESKSKKSNDELENATIGKSGEEDVEEEADTSVQKGKDPKRKRNKKSALDELNEKLNKHSDFASDEEVEDEKEAEEGEEIEAKSTKKKKDKFDSKLEKLKSGLDASEDILGKEENNTEAEAKSENEEAEDIGDLSAKKEKKNSESSAEKVTKKLAAKSPAIQEFLERRKHKEPKAAAPPAEVVNTNPYLGIFVALSDGVNLGRDARRAVMNTIRAIEGSMENSLVLVTDADKSGGEATIRYSNRPDKPEGSKIALENGLVYPIAKSTEISGVVLGCLYVEALPPKTGFDAVQSETLKKAAQLLWPVLSREAAKNSEKKAA